MNLTTCLVIIQHKYKILLENILSCLLHTILYFQAEIKNALETVCRYLPSEFTDTCSDLVTTNFAKVMEFLVDEMNPKVICGQLGVCAAQVGSNVVRLRFTEMVSIWCHAFVCRKRKKLDYCAMCVPKLLQNWTLCSVTTQHR